MKFIKKFEAHDPDYLNYMNSENKILPNLSYCEDVGDVHLNPWVETRLVAKFNVTSTSSATNIMASYSTSQFSEIEIDGVIQPSVVSSYTFTTTGEHTVKYTLVNPTIINSVFFNCTSLTSVTIPNSVTSIADFAFELCPGLTSVTIPDSVTSIGEGAFISCGSLTSITIPDSVTSIGNFAFNSCESLTSITIPNSVTSIGFAPFVSCSGLASITVDSSNTVYDSRDNCNAIIETATNKLIAGCVNTSIPNIITTIGNGAFGWHTGLISIIIPNSVTSIDTDAFVGCTGLTSVTIPNSVTTIGEYAFDECSSVTSVIVQATTPPTLGRNAFDTNASGRKIYVPSGSVTAYKSATNWSNYALDIEPIN